ncbi:MAG: hypothetical protein EXR79_11030 [Myxococcales bacterium]|nr:hypothetical protein [Myxococcales bacterium]
MGAGNRRIGVGVEFGYGAALTGKLYVAPKGASQGGVNTYGYRFHGGGFGDVEYLMNLGHLLDIGGADVPWHIGGGVVFGIG